MSRSTARAPKSRKFDVKSLLAGTGLGAIASDTVGSLLAHVIRDVGMEKIQDLMRGGVLSKDDAEKAFERLTPEQQRDIQMRFVQLEAYAKAVESDTTLSPSDKERMIKKRSEELMAGLPKGGRGSAITNPIETLLKSMDPRGDKPEVRQGFNRFWRKLPSEQRKKLMENANKIAPTMLAVELEALSTNPTTDEVLAIFEESMSTVDDATAETATSGTAPKGFISRIMSKDYSGAIDDATKTLPPKLPPMQHGESQDDFWTRILPLMQHLKRDTESDGEFRNRFKWVIGKAQKEQTFQIQRRSSKVPFNRR
jgi:hypothetical protein